MGHVQSQGLGHGIRGQGQAIGIGVKFQSHTGLGVKVTSRFWGHGQSIHKMWGETEESNGTRGQLQVSGLSVSMKHRGQSQVV